jgi:hypothetical protein
MVVNAVNFFVVALPCGTHLFHSSWHECIMHDQLTSFWAAGSRAAFREQDLAMSYWKIRTGSRNRIRALLGQYTRNRNASSLNCVIIDGLSCCYSYMRPGLPTPTEKSGRCHH